MPGHEREPQAQELPRDPRWLLHSAEAHWGARSSSVSEKEIVTVARIGRAQLPVGCPSVSADQTQGGSGVRCQWASAQGTHLRSQTQEFRQEPLRNQESDSA